MFKYFILSTILLTSINARENPFFPVKGEKDIPVTSNSQVHFDPLERATISLPSTARLIEKVTVSYKNLDGSIEQTSIDLNNSVDWHLPLFVSQNYDEKKEQKSVVKKEMQHFKEIAKFEYGTFYADEKTLKIVTHDKLIRNFMLVTPHRIVLDFGRETNLKTYLEKIKNSVFTKIRVGNHDKFYRVVIELDGFYTYTLQNSDDGYIFHLN